jgi:hypothetical protein
MAMENGQRIPYTKSIARDDLVYRCITIHGIRSFPQTCVANLVVVSRQAMRSQRVPGALPPGPRTKLGLLCKELFFLFINLTLAGDEVDFVKRDDLRFEVKFVAGPEDEEDGDGDVGGDECIGLKRYEGVVTFEKGDDSGGDNGEV